MKWKDKREVNIMSTKQTLDFAATGKVHWMQQTKVMKPTAVIDYNMKMRGVDVGDRILSKFHVIRRYNTAYKKIFFYVVDMMLLNSYELYKKLHGKEDRTFHTFKQRLAEELLESYFKEDVVKIRSVTPGNLPSRLSQDTVCDTWRFTFTSEWSTFPRETCSLCSKGGEIRKSCVVCFENKQRREST
ncbi:hypothetical protein PR048_011179 [Dryococelus australis]|uniref:PiggyBac transposable element-derived protein domain-containing protein n=1 Tax=Dryococelus australis TaxID=614101 RepID=A0ABQ9HKU6_9NEOP|nr:hypothetical protein PR048_011179 [Dryococelus australis]